MNGYGKLIVGGVVTLLTGILLTMILSSFSKWRDFELVAARQTLIIQELRSLAEQIRALDRKDTEMDLKIERLIQRQRLQTPNVQE